MGMRATHEAAKSDRAPGVRRTSRTQASIARADGPRHRFGRCRIGAVRAARAPQSSTTWQVPPAASMAARAAALNLCAWTVSGLESSPFASTFTGMPFFVHSPCECSASSVTASPDSKRASRSPMLKTWVCVRNGSNGIDFFMCGPRSLRMRMWIGIWPPSKLWRVLAPEREPAPFWARPDVLPGPEPSPRPMRLRLLRLPGAGLSVCRPKSSFSFSVIDPHQVAHAVQHAARLRAVLDLDRVADAAEPERAQRVELLLVRAVLAPDLRHLHDAGASSAAAAS